MYSKTWEKNFTGKSMVPLALFKSTDTFFIGQIWNKAEVAKSTCKQKSQAMQKEQVQIHWKSGWPNSISCRQKKPAFSYTGRSHSEIPDQ